METKELLGRRLRDLRKKKGLTLVRVAEIAAVSKKSLESIEHGNGNPTIGTLEKIARGLSVKLRHILEFENELQDERSLRWRVYRVCYSPWLIALGLFPKLSPGPFPAPD